LQGDALPHDRIWIHFVWSTKNRQPILRPLLKSKLIRHIRLNAREKRIAIDSINGGVDHLHVLLRLHPSQSPAQVMQLIKGESSHWMNQNGNPPSYFEWQDEYYAASVGERSVAAVRRYIRNQEKHHQIREIADNRQVPLQGRP
jgi:REP element-mobilizing transposase RayT